MIQIQVLKVGLDLAGLIHVLRYRIIYHAYSYLFLILMYVHYPVSVADIFKSFIIRYYLEHLSLHVPRKLTGCTLLYHFSLVEQEYILEY